MDAFAWGATGTKHVVYGTPDGHVHELTWSKGVLGSGWSHADLTEVTGAPPATDSLGKAVRPLPIAFEWPEKGAKQVCYLSARPGTTYGYEIHELYVVKGGSWKHANLSKITGKFAATGPIRGFAWAAGDTKQYVCGDGAGGVMELYTDFDGPWKSASISAAAGAPKGGFYVTGSEWAAAGIKQVFRRADDGSIQQLYVGAGGKWTYANLSKLAGGPNNAYETHLSAFAWKAGSSNQVVYRGGSAHINELSTRLGGTWRHADLTAVTGAPSMDAYGSFDAFAWEAGKAKQVVYRAASALHELYVRAGETWQHENLTKLTGAPAPAGSAGFAVSGFEFPSGGTKCIVYFDDFGHLHELAVGATGGWVHTDLTDAAGAPEAF